MTHLIGNPMAGGSLLMLLDDITTMLDDVSVMTKVAAKKTAGVLGDDLALNAQQVSGVDASRELPVVWAVAKGSFINKLILVPAALAISYFIPWLITPLLMLGGAFLCFEGAEKIAHKLLHSSDDVQHEADIKQAIQDASVDLVAIEKDKIKGAIRTDFILSAEIIVIALGTVATAPFTKQVTVVSLIALIMTIGVYGLVAGIVKLDDLGLHLILKKGSSMLKQIVRKIGSWLLAGTPYLMRFLSIAGTAAMFLVGGSIIGHGLPFIHHINEAIVAQAQGVAMVGGFLSVVAPLLIDATIGLIVGAICVAVYTLFLKVTGQQAA
jgi:predicted DNA repair protein MutK